jgi:hypothetical protein
MCQLSHGVLLALLQATQLSLQLLSALAADSEAIPVLRHSKAIKPIVDLVHNVQQAPGTLQQWLLHALSHLAQNAAACEEMAAGGAGVALLQLLEATGVHAPRAALMSTALVALMEGSRNARMSLVHAGVCLCVWARGGGGGGATFLKWGRGWAP